MKRLAIFSILALSSALLLAQPACVKDAWMSLQQKKVGPAKRTIDEGLAANADNADYWLMRGNVYLQRYEYEQGRKKEDSKYVIKDPDAILIADESFVKALTLNPKVQPLAGMYDANTGQILCAGPLFAMAEKAKKEEDWENAYKYLNLAAKDLKLDKENSKIAEDLGYTYFELAQIALKMNNEENFKQMLQDGMNAKAPFPEIYTYLYSYYKEEKDTAGCAKVVNAAKKNVKAKDIDQTFELELDYLTMTQQPEKINKVADKALEKYANNATAINVVASYLIDAMDFAKADTLLLAGLDSNRQNFELTSQMGYRYLYEATAFYGKKMDAATQDKNWDLRKQLDEQRKVVLEKALEWCTKAYNINADNMENNIRLQQTYVLLLRIQDIPAELKAKVESYQKK